MSRWNTEPESAIPKAFWYVAPVVIALAAAAGYYFYTREQTAEEEPVAEAPAPPAPVPESTEPTIEHPLPETVAEEPAEPLPPLNESDADVRESLVKFAGEKPVERFLVPENIVRNFVVTVDNLPRSKVAVERRPVKPIGGSAIVSTQGDITVLSEKNYERYAPFMKLVREADTKQLAALYFRYYPLFQQAYEDLGYPGEFFNDRVVEVIDHLLATPNVRGPIQLVQPKVFYEFADPQLEARSAGQKLLIRMGPANAQQIKAKLRELRTEITTGRDPPSQTQGTAADGPAEDAPKVSPDTSPTAAPSDAPR